ncbi:hypothetical protein SDJN03_18627, partial [Cucurbita argyrosperma subsp. sororia]
MVEFHRDCVQADKLSRRPKVECVAFMYGPMHMYVAFPLESLLDLGSGEISWAEFKEAFAEGVLPRGRPDSQTSGVHPLEAKRCVRLPLMPGEFAKLKCFASRFAPTTYANALRVARAMEGTSGLNESRPSTERQKRRFVTGDDYHKSRSSDREDRDNVVTGMTVVVHYPSPTLRRPDRWRRDSRRGQ